MVFDLDNNYIRTNIPTKNHKYLDHILEEFVDYQTCRSCCGSSDTFDIDHVLFHIRLSMKWVSDIFGGEKQCIRSCMPIKNLNYPDHILRGIC
jgi:hypothetical protein